VKLAWLLLVGQTYTVVSLKHHQTNDYAESIVLIPNAGLSPVPENEWQHTRPRYDSWPPRRTATQPTRNFAQPILPLPGNSPTPANGAEYDNEISTIPHDLTYHSQNSQYSQPAHEPVADVWPTATAPFSLPPSNRTAAELRPSPARIPRVQHLETEAFPFVPEATHDSPATPTEMGRAKSFRADVGYVYPRPPGGTESSNAKR
jgi:hypothetical protein